MTTNHKLAEDEEYIEMQISSNLYTEADSAGKQKLIKKNIVTRLSVYVYDIDGHEEVFDSKGKVMTKVCKIYHKNLGPLIVKKTYNEIKELKERYHIGPQTKSVGFQTSKKK